MKKTRKMNMKKTILIQTLFTIGIVALVVGCHKKSSIDEPEDTSSDTTNSSTDSQQFEDSDTTFYGKFMIVNETNVVLYVLAKDLVNAYIDLFENSVGQNSSEQFYSIEAASNENVLPSKVFSELQIDFDITGGIGHAYEGVVDTDWTQSDFDENNEKTFSLTITNAMVE